MELSFKLSPTLCVVAGILVPLVLYHRFSKYSLRAIPTVGGSSIPLLSYLRSFDYLDNLRGLLQEGYDKYKGGTFKISLPDRWLVVVTGSRLIDELQRLPEDEASFNIGGSELFGTRYVFHMVSAEEPYHLEIISRNLTRNIARMFDDLHDEIRLATADLIPATEQGWVSISALSTMEDLVARVSNRVFVGPQYCRNQDYLDMVLGFSRSVYEARRFVGMFPTFLKRFAARRVVDIGAFAGRGMRLMGPTIMERREKALQSGSDSSDKPIDMLQWLVEAAVERNQPPAATVIMMFIMNFASIFTTSTSLTHALLHLAAEPGYVKMLRDEVETIVAAEGWSKSSIGKMQKLDSFLRESQRYNGTNLVSLTRMSLKDLKLSDGTFIPTGTLVVAPALPTHRDPENYTNSDEFDPLRFVNLSNEESSGNGSAKYQFVTTSAEYLGFGHGKHACPGRFFASSELKTILAHIILNYDMKLEREKLRPQNWYNAFVVVPSPTAHVLFKKRST